MPARLWFTQYLRPDGRKQIIGVDRPDNVVAVADNITKQGFKLEIEQLITGHVSLTIFDPQVSEDVAIEVCENGPLVPVTVDKLILGFNLPNALKRRELLKPRNPDNDNRKHQVQDRSAPGEGGEHG